MNKIFKLFLTLFFITIANAYAIIDTCSQHSYMGLEEFQKKNYSQALKHFDLFTKCSNSTEGYYNLACTYAQLKNIDKSFYYLNKIVAQGYCDSTSVVNDHDLIFCHSDKRWNCMLRTISQNRINTLAYGTKLMKLKEKVIPYGKNGKWGYMNMYTREIVTPAIFIYFKEIGDYNSLDLGYFSLVFNNSESTLQQRDDQQDGFMGVEMMKEGEFPIAKSSNYEVVGKDYLQFLKKDGEVKLSNFKQLSITKEPDLFIIGLRNDSINIYDKDLNLLKNFFAESFYVFQDVKNLVRISGIGFAGIWNFKTNKWALSPSPNIVDISSSVYFKDKVPYFLVTDKSKKSYGLNLNGNSLKPLK